MASSQSNQRLDIWLVENKFFKSRNSAANAIQAGGIILNGMIEKKISKKITTGDKVELNKDHKVYVSRSAGKLKYLIEKTNKNISDYVCLDLGASTGGFTQVLLEFGVGKVYAVDVGFNQLDPSIKEDSKVINMEKVDVRDLDKDLISSVDLISVDLSFISLDKALNEVFTNARIGTFFYILFKPQFEVGINEVNKKGVVKNSSLAWNSINKFLSLLKLRNFSEIKLFKSPILGKDGNEEWLIFAEKE